MRAGSQSVTIEMTIAQKDIEGKSETVGSALMSFSRLPRRHDNPDLEIKRETAEGYRFVGASPELTGSFPERVGIDVLDEANGVVELRMTPYVRNSFGALQGGMVAFLGDVAGQIAARKAAGREVLTNDLTVTYLAQGRRGPFRTSAKVLRMTRDTVLTQIDILDKGAEGRLITVVMNTATLG
jgi:uncharacterized protein (TIGR00369 family)